METIIVKTKKWGNSLGIRLPKEIVRENNIKPEEKIVIQIGKPHVTKVKDIFGKLQFKKPTEELMKEIDRGLWGE
ncbi:MAG: AbrB/MazE/SpoVT family DNA-binding domain-containing protein [Nanoarchaeota archaeon]